MLVDAYINWLIDKGADVLCCAVHLQHPCCKEVISSAAATTAQESRKSNHGVALRDLNLEYFILFHMSSQAGEALAPTASQTN